MRKEAQRWFSEALWDLETAKILHEKERYNSAVFYAHQSAEKAVKALLYKFNEATLENSVRELLERFFEKLGERDEKILSFARELDRHYITSRYPDSLPSGTPHEAYDAETSKKAYEIAEKVMEYARKFIER